MPPKARFSKAQITEAALAIVREGGVESLTARTLGSRLGSSARPIFTVFAGMDELMTEVKNAAGRLYGEYVQRGLEQERKFRGVGERYIAFAMSEPQLFRLLFMSGQGTPADISDALSHIEENYDAILMSIQSEYDFDRDTAERLYRHLWIYTHGVATLAVTRMCTFSGDDIAKLMSEVCVALVASMRK